MCPARPVDTHVEASVAFVGSGGSGVMTAGELLLQSAAECGLYGIMTRSYGPQIRGGESAAFVRLGTRPFEKQADRIDLGVAFDFRNADRFKEELVFAPDSRFFYEQSEGKHLPEWAAAGESIAAEFRQLAGTVDGGRGRPNMVALGLLGYLLGLEETAVLRALAARFSGGDPGMREGNAQSVQAGRQWAEQTGARRLCQLSGGEGGGSPWVLTGNQGIVIGSLAAGCQFYAGYPITPATDIMEALGHYLPRRGGVMIQAEDELAAVNMAIGASFGGQRAMTATSGPGFSLMAEGLGLALMAEIPLVVIDVMRTGPSTGIPTKTEQSDLWAAFGSSHGDNPRVVMAASSVRGCIEMTVRAFGIAERFQVPVILLSDQFLGGRTEIIDAFPLPSPGAQGRGAVMERAGSPYRRYPLSGGIAPMPVPGIAGGEYTADGLEHDERGRPDASHAMHQRQSEKRLGKLDPLAGEEGWVEHCGDPAASSGIIGWGSTGGVIREAVRMAQTQGRSLRGIIPHLLYPPQTTALNRIFRGMDVLYVAELSLSGQFLRYLRAFCELPPKVVPIARAGGTPFRTLELLSFVEER